MIINWGAGSLEISKWIINFLLVVFIMFSFSRMVSDFIETLKAWKELRKIK